MAKGYDYDWNGLGLMIYTPSGEAFIQGQEGSDLFDELEGMTEEQIEAFLSEYEHICE